MVINMKETKEFLAESQELLNLMINSIYSNKEIFLREVISNASDAIDKYKFAALTESNKLPILDYKIEIIPNEKERTIVVKDNGIGMTKTELIDNLGTIAKSGSKEFLSKLKDAKKSDDISIIGQFGVGFYSCFMVADKVEVLTKSPFEASAYLFTSDGKKNYTIEEAKKDDNGTIVRIYLRKDEKEGVQYGEYLHEYKIRELVKKYSDYIRYPIVMDIKKREPKLDDKGQPIKDEYVESIESETLNSMIPLWKKNKKELKEEEINEFYKNKFYDYENPLTYLSLHVDGRISYDALLFIPSHVPYNLYSENYEKGLDLYAKGIFIQEKCKELIPDYLKFVKGLVESNDFSLNISREMLQNSPLLKRIEENIEKKIVDKLTDLKEHDYEKYLSFYKNFGDHIKFGIYSTYGAKKDLLQDLLLFKTLKHGDEYISLKKYVEEMSKEQKEIYYVAGKNLEQIKMLPQLDSYRQKEEDVLLCDHEIDDFVIMMMNDYDKKPFKNISMVDAKTPSNEEKEKIDTLIAENKRFIDNVRDALKEDVDEVTFSLDLVNAPVCLKTKDGLSMNMAETLNNDPTRKEGEEVKAKKVLEINPNHQLFQNIIKVQNDEETKMYAKLLYDEAMLLEGIDIKDKASFVKRLNDLLLKAIGE